MKNKIEYEKLPKKFKRDWLKALRSGEYKKGTSCLYNKVNDTYCCLGVAASICGARKSNLNNVGTIKHKKGIRGISKIPACLIDVNEYGFDSIIEKLVNLNDASYKNDKSFSRVANWIEKNL